MPIADAVTGENQRMARPSSFGRRYSDATQSACHWHRHIGRAFRSSVFVTAINAGLAKAGALSPKELECRTAFPGRRVGPKGPTYPKSEIHKALGSLRRYLPGNSRL